MRTHWTKAEVDLLRRLYPTHTAAEIGQRLGRTAKAVHEAAKAHGLTKFRRIRWDEAAVDRVRRLNRAGYNASEIAGRLGCERHAVARLQARLGLPDRSRGPRWRRKVAAATQRQCAAAGVASLAEVRSLAFRQFARGRRWPEDLAPREVMILDTLEARGPLDRRQIAEALGMPWHGSRQSLKCSKGRGAYLANLVAAGLVVRLGRLRRGRGRGHSTCVYTLAPAAIREVDREAEVV